MPLNVRVFQLGLLPLLLGGLIGCNQLANSGFAFPGRGNLPLTQIGELQQQQNGDSIVYLKGKVGRGAPFLGSGAYQLQDPTGTVWVLTDESLPSQGDEVLIKGQVEYQSIPFGEQELGEFYLVELEQLERQAKPPAKPVDDLFLPHKSNE